LKTGYAIHLFGMICHRQSHFQKGLSLKAVRIAAFFSAGNGPVELYRHWVHAPSLREAALDKPTNKANASVPAETRCLLVRCFMANVESLFSSGKELQTERNGTTCSDAGNHRRMTMLQILRLEKLESVKVSNWPHRTSTSLHRNAPS
jgi:hypothetical protein